MLASDFKELIKIIFQAFGKSEPVNNSQILSPDFIVQVKGFKRWLEFSPVKI